LTNAFRVAVVATECAPLARDGGRADVVAGLADSLAHQGHVVRLFLPAYRDLTVPREAKREIALAHFDVPLGERVEPAALVRLRLPRSHVEYLLVQHLGDARYFDRPGNLRDPATGRDHADNGARFAFFGRATLEALRALGEKPDVVHACEPRAAWALAFLRRELDDDAHFVRTGGIYTTLDPAPPMREERAALAAAGLREDADDPWAKHVGDTSFPLAKLGLRHADLVALSSARYAALAPDDTDVPGDVRAVLAARRKDLVGIVPGIDTKAWDPGADSSLPARYSASQTDGKRACRRALSERAGWPTDAAQSGWDRPIVGLIAPLLDEKGLDLVRESIDRLLDLDLRLAVLGTGEIAHEAFWKVLARRRPERVFARVLFDDTVARQIVAGSDVLLVPSRREPGGRQQLRALRYGAIPVVHATGGLAETVKEFDPATSHGDGFQFEPYTAEAMVAAVRRAVETYEQPHLWHRLMHNAMTHDVSYDATAAAYVEAYREVKRRREARRFSTWALGMARG
jgi:starch synthase